MTDNVTMFPAQPAKEATARTKAAARARRYRKRKRDALAGTPAVTPPLPPADAPTATSAGLPGRAGNVVAYATASLLTAVAAWFSVGGMAEIFPGASVAVMALAVMMELSKLVIAGWVAHNWRVTVVTLRVTLVALTAGLALINAAGVCGRLVEAHVGVMVAASSGVAERIEGLEARIAEQARTVSDIDIQIGQIDGAIAKLTEKGNARVALVMAEQQRKVRDALSVSREKAAGVLVDLRTQRAALDGQRQRVEASIGPVRYLATVAGMETEAVVRWLILLMVLCCDPAAIALTVAASGRLATAKLTP
jgi:uncharacterized coiled-coil protein SlyX